jgi:2-dehydro-3-deoxyglucarate aldolase
MNPVKHKLKNGIPTIGTWMQIPSPFVAEILASNGFDWITLDLEHGPFSLNLLPDMIRAIELQKALPFIRVAQNHPKDIKQALDAGAKGIIVPMIETEKQAKDFVSWSSYPPNGTRGVGFSNANLFGKYFEDYSKNINDDLIRVIQIENIKALDEIEAIFSTQGLDAAMIGPYDLSGSMNLTGQFDNPMFLSTIEKFQNAANKAKLPLGIHIIKPDEDLLKSEIKNGKSFIAFSTDAAMLNQKSNIQWDKIFK